MRRKVMMSFILSIFRGVLEAGYLPLLLGSWVFILNTCTANACFRDGGAGGGPRLPSPPIERPQAPPGDWPEKPPITDPQYYNM
jgi:hypothetical protein